MVSLSCAAHSDLEPSASASLSSVKVAALLGRGACAAWRQVGASGSSALAKPLYLQRLERTLRLDTFLRQTAAIFNRDITR